MISMAFKRVSEELLNGAAYGIDLKMADCSWNELEAVFQGPSDSPYAEGTFVISLKVPEVFPFQPPKVKFITRIWHPNVSAGDGSMCDDFLRDWPASMTIRGLCIFIQSLLLQPDLEKPICPVAAQQLVNTPLTYTETAKYWTKCYARGLCLDREFTSELVEKESKVLGLFYRTERPIEEIRIALSVADWNYGLAFEFLNEPSPPSPFAYIKEEPEDEDRKSISLDNLPAEALEGVVRVIIGTEDESEGELSEISSLAGSYYMDDYDNCVYDDDDGSFIDDMDSSEINSSKLLLSILDFKSKGFCRSSDVVNAKNCQSSSNSIPELAQQEIRLAIRLASISIISMAFKRVSEELLDGAAYGIDLKMVDTSWNDLQAGFQGPSGSPYAEGTFLISLKIPEVFPFHPPKVKFMTRIWHPNVSAIDGSMCDNFLQDWPAAMTIRGLCIFIQSLLLEPDLQQPMCPEAAQQLIKTPLIFKENANYWTRRYAPGPCLDSFTSAVVENEAKILSLMHLTKRKIEEVRIALSVADWNYDMAFKSLTEQSGSNPVTCVSIGCNTDEDYEGFHLRTDTDYIDVPGEELSSSTDDEAD